MPVVFVNYRVMDQPGYATLLYRELAQRFGRESVFLAPHSIRAGDDFVDEVFENLRRCEVLLALIGPRWQELQGDNAVSGRATFDWVRREIAEAFTLDIRVIPVLIEDVDLPNATDLPADIAALSRCQCLRLRHYSIDSDLNRLVDELGRALARRTRPEMATTVETPLYRLAGRTTSSCLIGVVPGAIRRVRFADIWVNSENTDMQMARHTEFSVSAIIRYWGSVRDDAGRVVDDLIANELAAQVTHRPVAPGTVFVAGAGALTESNNVRHIIHTAAVHGEPGAGYRQVRHIGYCVTNVLDQAEKLAEADPAVRTVLIPLLGTGVASAPIAPTARAMLSAALDHLTHRSNSLLRAIYFLAYSEQEQAVFHDLVRMAPLVTR